MTFKAALSTGVDGLTYIDETLGEVAKVAVGISPVTSVENAEALMNDFIAQLKDDGTLEDMYTRWVLNADYTMPDIPAPSSPDKTIRVGTTGLEEPYTFYTGDRLNGYEIELINRFALYANADIIISTYNWDGIIPACTSGKVDYVMSNLFGTSERRESIGFSDPRVSFLPDPIADDDLGFVFPQTDKGNALRDQMNLFLAELEADGTLEALAEKWIENNEGEKDVISPSSLEDINGTLRLATNSTNQHSALPSVFPPFPHRTDFDIFASMDAAKEVGGDFYDFYFTGNDEFAFLIADVSGKGIPAAMFMMRAKTLIKSYAEAGMSVEEVLTLANEKLCEGNDAEMFVTAWMGKINLATGVLTFANAGHNPPLLQNGDGRHEYLKSRAGFVLGGMGGIRYKKNELLLAPGAVLFLYTDGVTEATSAAQELYGETRLKEILDRTGKCDPKFLCSAVKSDVDQFVGDEPLSVIITVIDGGVPFNPLQSADPDVTRSAEERDIGGLGICMVKKAWTKFRMNIAMDTTF